MHSFLIRQSKISTWKITNTSLISNSIYYVLIRSESLHAKAIIASLMSYENWLKDLNTVVLEIDVRQLGSIFFLTN